MKMVEAGIDARERERAEFLALANKLVNTLDKHERDRLKETLARMIFGT